MKLKALQTWMSHEKIDAVLLYNLRHKDTHVAYFSAISEGGIFLVITQKGATLYCNRMDFELVKKTSLVKQVVLIKQRGFEEIAKHIKGKVLGINRSIMTLAEHEYLKKMLGSFKYVDVNKKLVELRSTKTEDEIQKLRTACEITDAIFLEVLKELRDRAFRTEREVERFILEKIDACGCEMSFEPLVSSGVRSSMPHGKLKGSLSSGFCYLDFGVKYKGYCSDMTRTLYFGKPSKKEVEDYFLVRSVLQGSEERISKGASFKDVDAYARSILGERFIHSLGHGVGVEIHESPNLSPMSTDRVEENMVFTIEPGMYIPGKYGIRIENTYLFNGKGLQSLMKSGTDLVVIS